MKIASLILAALLFSGGAFAEVDHRNGNFAITFRDLPAQQGGQDLGFCRTFNSLATTRGWVGFGWGTRYETKLLAMPDNSIVVQDNGTGQKTWYFGNHFQLQDGVSRIVAAEVARKKLAPAETAALARLLLASDEARFRLARDLELPVSVAQNETFKSDGCSEGSVVRTDSGYLRVLCEGARETFDTKGRLTASIDPDGYGFDVEYRNDQAQRIIDTNGQIIDLSWRGGFLASASHNGNAAEYLQDGKGNLSTSKDERSNTYTYKYDAFHNLTQIDLVDINFYRMAYDDSSSGQVNQVTDPQGSVTQYEYLTDPLDGLHRVTRVSMSKVPYANGQGTTVSEYELEEPFDSQGQQKVLSVRVANNKQATGKAYDDKGRITRTTDREGNILEIVYHPVTQQIIMIFSRKANTEIRYAHDKMVAQIIVHTPKSSVTLSYTQGRLNAMSPNSVKDPHTLHAVALALQNLVELQAK